MNDQEMTEFGLIMIDAMKKCWSYPPKEIDLNDYESVLGSKRIENHEIFNELKCDKKDCSCRIKRKK